MKMRNLILSCVVLLCSQAWAVYKCVQTDGRVVFQDSACAITTKTSEKVKIWGSEGFTGKRLAALPAVVPNAKLAGPPGSEPLLGLYRRWADAERLAMSTSRIALGGPAGNLQALQREVEALKVPGCLEGAHKTLTALITKSAEAILQFMGKEEITGMVYQAVDRRTLVPEFEKGITTANCQ